MWWIAVFLVWTILALMSASQTAIYVAYSGQHVSWPPLLIGRLADWYTCAVFIPAFAWLARRWPLGPGRWRRHLPMHMAASFVAVALKYAIYLPIQRHLQPSRPASYPALLAANALTELMIFWATIAVIHAIEFYRRYRDREAVEAELRNRLTRAQLDALRVQLQPHFLFNTLNAIATLLHRDARAADAMIGRLAGLLRASLRHDAGHLVPLHTELGLARSYVEIMRERFGPRLDVVIETPPGLEGAEVPAFILQPLIENAFEHGLSRVTGPMRLEVCARADDTHLELLVRDNGAGPANGVENVGLGNTRQRLRELYGADQVLELRSDADGGTLARVRVPLTHPSRDSLAAAHA